MPVDERSIVWLIDRALRLTEFDAMFADIFVLIEAISLFRLLVVVGARLGRKDFVLTVLPSYLPKAVHTEGLIPSR